MFKETPEDQAIIAWHDSQTEETLASLPGYEDGLTPRQAWAAFCSLPATQQPGESLAAPADAGQGVSTLNVQSGSGMVHMHIGRNRSAWLQIAAALDKHPQRDLFNHARRVGAAEAARTAEGAPPRGEVAGREASAFAINFGGCVAPCTSLVPDGNHGDNFDEVRA